MRLSKLTIYGFKSFAKRTEIVFPLNVTGIVGPNGSGKSNISDAVRWVLGEQSAKTLRGNSMSDVIFNGTEKRKPMNYCEVALVFDNEDHQLPVDFTEVCVTRRVFRSGESEYLLNGSACRLKDIVDLFRDTGIGREGYSIIGQGRIDEILSQRSEDRRAAFEEAAGISRFKTRKEEAEARLKRADENLVRVLDVLEELQSHLTPLEKQADVAKKYLALSDALKELDVQLFLTRYDRAAQRAATVEQAMLSIRDAIAEAESRIAALSDERALLEGKQDEAQADVKAANDALLALSDALHRVKEQALTVENALKSGAETIKRLAGEAEAVRARIALIEKTMSQSDGGLGEADRIRAEKEQALAECRERHAQSVGQVEKLDDELSAHKAAILERMNRVQNVRMAQARQSAMRAQISARKAELEQELEAENARDEALTGALADAQESLAQEQARLEALRAESERFEASVKQMLSDILQKQRLVQEHAQSARGVETRLKTLRELQDGYEGYQYAVKNALSYARQRKLSGVRDVVAMLLRVPREYETALDMALGGAMQNIVTETEQDAKILIEHLRENRMGRATFLPMATVRGRTLSAQEREVLSMKGCLGVASELCSFDECYRPIMESLLGRTVVAEDLDSGIAIMRAGRHAFRLVTLAGDVMHSGGSITGGSIQQRVQNLLGREREIGELKADLKRRTDALAREQEALNALENERNSVKERRESAQYGLHQQEIAVVRDSEHVKAAQAALDAHRLSARELSDAVAQLAESLESLDAELAGIDRETDEGQTSVEELNARTEALSERLNTARRAREATQEALTAAMLALQEAEHNREQLARDKKRLLLDSETCARELDALARKRAQAAQDMEDASRRQEACARDAAQAEESVAQARSRVEESERLREARQRELKDAQNELEGAQLLLGKETERLHRQEVAQTRLKAELAQMTDRLWDTYELTYAGAREARDAFALVRQSARAEGGGEDKPFVEAEADQEAQRLRDEIRALGNVNVGAIEEFAQMHERYTELDAQKGDLERAKADLQDLIQRLLARMKTQFVSQFTLLQGFFSETFERLFGGGVGEIRLEDPTEPLTCGIEIIVQPPGKKRQLLSLFSGGERALTAIAILFAMLKLRPSPFCILDEIEAALDEANIAYFADYLKEFSADTQFIVVTHRKGTMERCDTLFGVAMEERGVSAMVSVNLTDYE